MSGILQKSRRPDVSAALFQRDSQKQVLGGTFHQIFNVVAEPPAAAPDTENGPRAKEKRKSSARGTGWLQASSHTPRTLAPPGVMWRVLGPRLLERSRTHRHLKGRQVHSRLHLTDLSSALGTIRARVPVEKMLSRLSRDR